MVGICGLLLASGWLLPEPAAAGRHTAAECRAACESRNIPASCEWLTRVPQRCIRDAERACQRNPVPGAAQCLPPKDLPACGSNNSCPYGSLCVDATCQVVGCGSHDGVADCTGNNACKYDKCVVADCSGATANCPKGFHCAVENSEFGDRYVRRGRAGRELLHGGYGLHRARGLQSEMPAGRLHATGPASRPLPD